MSLQLTVAPLPDFPRGQAPLHSIRSPGKTGEREEPGSSLLARVLLG